MTVRRAFPVFLFVLFAFLATTASAISPNIVISQVYGGAGCGTVGCSTYKNDYIELFNRSAAPVTLTNWSVQYAAATGTAWQVTTVNATIPAGGYFLVAQSANANGVNNLPTPDATGTIAMSATVAKVALVNTNTALSGQCGNGATLTLPSSVVDFVGYGTTANCNDAGATTGGTGNAPAPSTTNATFRAAGGCTDTDSNSADFAAAAAAPRNSATTPAPCGGPPPLPTLNISDVSQAETNAGTTTFTFAVTLSAPAAGIVTFDIATADGTAQDDNPGTEDNDYVANSLTGQSIPMGSTGPYNFSVTVNGDATTEANETFFVNVTNVVGANAGDVQGQGTIQNDDISLVFIHDVQGNGAASPVPGANVSIRGIVTLLKSNGFFLQEEVGDYDADPNTSEGIFVFTSSAPAVAVGDQATVTGTVVEFNGLTEISPASSIIVNSTGNPLPTAVVLTTADLPPTGGIAQPQLEKYESMRVTAASLTTVAPNDSFFDVETVLTGEARPMREPGIPVSDPIPPDPTSGLPDCCIPIWDENPERLSVDTNGRSGSTGETLTSNVTLTGVTGPLDFSFSRYRLINEANLTRTANMSAVPVPLPAANEFTIAGYNIENFNNAATQRQKAALTVRDVLRLPDIIGTVEIFDLADLQALATEIQTISGVAYSAHLIEQDGTSEDSDQDVGFLVKTSRVSVTSVTQEGAAETFINPNTGLPETLHDRPPLVLRATVDPTGPSPQPVIVVVNHLRSFIDVELVAGEGVRVREKRKKQAESLADLLNDLQTANPTTPVISLGDYNAFQFNSGYDDSISVITGAPTPDDQMVVDQSPDLVNPNFLNLLLNVPADQRYSFIFEGTPQSLDHVVVNTAADAINTAIAVARVNADFPEVPAAAFESNATRPERNSDHDPIVAYFQLPAVADVSITKTDSVDPVNAGQQLTYTVTVTNGGPDAADTVAWSDTLPAGTTFVSLSQPGGWTCTTPAVGANGTVNCSVASLGVTSAPFDVVVAVNANVATGTVLSNTASVTTTTPESNGGNNSDTETTTTATAADLQITKVDTPDPVTAGNNLTYTINIANAGPSDATGAVFTDTIPANTTFVSLTTFADFTCTAPPIGGTGLITCTKPSTFLAGSSGNFILVVNVDAATAAGTVITNTANVTSTTTETNSANDTATATSTVGAGSADVSVTKTDSPDPVFAGTDLTYTVTVTNAGPSSATSASWSDTLPAGTTFVSIASPAGWTCTTPAAGATGTVTCSTPTLGVTSAVFTLVVHVDPALVAGLSNTATATSATTDPNPANNSDTEATTVGTSADVHLTKTDSPDPVTAGNNLSYTITITNAGPSNANLATFTDALPAGTTFVSLSTTGGWDCTTPAVGATGTITCTNPNFLVTVDFFTVVVNVNPGLASGTVLTNTATIDSNTLDPNEANNSSTTTTTIGVGSADLSVTKTDSPDPVNAGGDITYTITVNNAGPTNAASAALNDTLPGNTTFVSLSAPAGWTCTTPAVGATGTVSCTNPSVASGSAVFSLVVRVGATTTPGTAITNTATVSSTTADPNVGNESATATTSVISPANVSGTKTVTGTFVPGSAVTYTITLANNGASTQQNNAGDELVDVLPAALTLVSATATGGTALANVGTNTVTWNGSILAGASVTITINATVRSDAAPGTVVNNQGTINYDADGNGTNESTRPTDSPSAGGASDPTTFTVLAPAILAAIPTLDELALLALAMLLATLAALMLKR